jgi:hypothetical protein
LLNAKKISERYDEQLKFVTRRGQPVKSVNAALIVPSESASQYREAMLTVYARESRPTPKNL